MKFKILGVNVEKVLFFSTPKITLNMTYNTKMYFFLRKAKKFNIYTSYLKHHYITFFKQF